MSIIEQLSQMETRANKYNEQRTVSILARHPQAGEKVPSFEVRVDFSSPNRANARAFFAFLTEHGICAIVHTSSIDGNLKNFQYLPAEKEAA
jgi:hypothetical protein